MTTLTNIYISVNASGADEEDLDVLMRELFRSLVEADNLVSVEQVRNGVLPIGAKGTPINASAIVVKFVELIGLKEMITVLGEWLSKDKSRSLKLQLGEKSLELEGLTKSEQKELIEWFKVQAALHLTP